MRCLLYLDIQSRRGDMIWLLLEKVIVTPVVCMRLFEFLPALTFGAQRGNHIVSTAFETIAKKQHRDKEGSLSTCDQQLIMNCQEHNQSWKGNASVLASMPSAVVS